MDHALACDSSKSPRKDHHVKGSVWMRQPLRRPDIEAHVSRTGLPGGFLRGCDSHFVWIKPLHVRRERCNAQGEAAVAAPEVQHTLTEHKRRAAPFGELIAWVGSESRGKCRDVPANFADWAGTIDAHAQRSA
jgi:hypothetical protein